MSLSTTVTFSDDDLRKCVEIELIDDDVDENQESFLVVVRSNDLPVFRPQAIVNILADAGEELLQLNMNIDMQQAVMNCHCYSVQMDS